LKSLDSETIIIGGGITGLMCAASLQRAGREYLLLESRGRLGGRIQTHKYKGFLLDAGFQTFLTSYDQGEPFLQPSALKLRNFDPGAYIADGRRLSYVGDPMRNFSCLLETLKCPAAGLKDRWLIWKLSQRLLRTPDCDIWNHREVSSFEYLQDLGFSDTFIDQFLRPFFGGVFLDNELSVSSRLFEFLFKRFTLGFASLPEAGMEAIPVA
jgi:phytoene dehydrogenase-like protein